MQEFTRSKVMVVGDVMLDDYWEGNADRISPEAPVPVVHVQKEYHKAGGAANVALNITSLKGNAYLLGLIGKDETGEKLKKLLKDEKVVDSFLELEEIHTIRKLRIISQYHQLLRTDFESNLHKIDKTQFVKLYQSHLKDINTVILSDYGKGTLSDPQTLIKLARDAGKTVLVDPKSRDFSIYNHATILTPNLKEFEAVVGHSETEEEMAKKAQNLIAAHHLEALLVTRGPQGMSLYQKNRNPVHIPTRAREVFDVTGAGDTVIGVLGMALSAGHDLETAVNLSNTAAGIVVGKMGTATVTPFELQQGIHENSGLQGGILDEESLKKMVRDAKHNGETVVMTNGCFDILHAGHVDYLTAAKKLGDRLIVAVNTDESVRRLNKGPERPINSLENRMKLLTALEAVDWVIPFSEDTPARLIESILPNVLVKGADYQIHQIAGSEAVLKNGGQVKTIALTPGCSTTNLINKIQQGEKK